MKSRFTNWFDRPGGTRGVVAGAALWVLFAIVAVAVRGVRWEETYGFAQVLLGLVVYPEGHPMPQHVCNMLCLQNYLTAGVMLVDPNPVIACGIRNVMYLVAKTLPFFLFGWLLTRNLVWAHLSALFAFFAGSEFWFAYVTEKWPISSTNGVIGLSFAVTALYFLAANQLRPAYFMIGLMPAWHIGQFPPLMIVAGLHTLDALLRKRRDFIKPAATGLAAGLAITALSAVVFLFTRVPPPESGPYYSDVWWWDVWRGFMHSFNYHRALGFGRDQIVMIWMPLLGTFAAVLEYKQTSRRGPWFWITVYGWVISVIVWSIMIIHYVMGDNMPPMLINWLPYRLPNHLSPLLLPMMTALIVNFRSPMLVLALISSLIAMAVGADAALVFLGINGITTHVIYQRLKPYPKFALAWDLIMTLVLILLWVFFGPLYFSCWAGGFMLAVFLVYLDGVRQSWQPRRSFARFTAAACVVSVIIALAMQWPERANYVQRLARTPFEQKVCDYLNEQHQQNAMLIVPPFLWHLQERLNHPITTEAAAPSWVPYHKTICGPLYNMYKDVYDLDMTDLNGNPLQWATHYREVWSHRSKQDWRQLADKYDYHYILAPHLTELQLPLVIKGDTFDFYEIPQP